jgi:copper chaperone CopZ
MKWKTRFVSVAILCIFEFVTAVQAQVEEVDIRVDGLACPFCAYGLEKKLKDIKGVGDIEINVDKGIAILQNKQGESIELERIESTVEDAGFTPRKLTASVTGKISRSAGSELLVVSDAKDQFILQENEQLKKLRSVVENSEKVVRVRGTIKRETPEKHHAHPYTIAVEEFEVIE